MNCFQMRAMMKAEGPWGFTDEDTPDYSASLYMKEPRTRKRGGGGGGTSLLARWSNVKARRQKKQVESEQARIDAILAKVSAHGMNSLNWFEKRALHNATERQRKREGRRPRV
jgi:hypothetical protein